MSNLSDELFLAVDDYIRRAVKPLHDRLEEQQATIARLEIAAREAPATGTASAGEMVNVRSALDAATKRITDLESRGPIIVRGIDGKPGEPGPRGADGAIGERGERGERGANGTSVEAKEVYKYLDDRLQVAIAALPTPKDGAPGERGDRGEKGADGLPGRDGTKGHDGAPGERGQKGIDGTNGRDGVSILSAVVDGDGELVLTASDGTTRKAGIVRGRDGKAGENGHDGAAGAAGRDAVAIRPLPSIDDAKAYPAGSWAVHGGGSWYAEQATEPLKGRFPADAGWTPIAVGEAKCDIALADDLRTIVVTRTTSTGLKLERRFVVPVVIDRGVYTAGRDYARGDAVTRNGSYFLAKADRPSGLPGASDDWRMLIKGAKP